MRQKDILELLEVLGRIPDKLQDRIVEMGKNISQGNPNAAIKIRSRKRKGIMLL